MQLLYMYVLMAATALLLLLVVVDQPYRDSQRYEGATEADKLQMLVNRNDKFEIIETRNFALKMMKFAGARGSSWEL